MDMHYFFKKDDGEIFACTKKHASNYIGEMEYLGALEDATVKKIHKEATEGQGELSEELDQLYRREEKIRENREKLLTEEFLPEDHEKVQRAEKRLEEIQEKIREKSDDLSEKREDGRQRVLKEAVEKADTDIVPPDTNYRAVTKEGEMVVGRDKYQRAIKGGL